MTSVFSVHRAGQSHYAPHVSDEEALDAAEKAGCGEALVVSFHSDMLLLGANPKWTRREGRSYKTNNYGEVTGQTYVIPVSMALGTTLTEHGPMDAFRMRDGTAFGILFQEGTPEIPVRVSVYKMGWL